MFFMRSKLFVPGSRPELYAKALSSGADAVSIDLEDAVAEERKDSARAEVAAFLRSEAALGAAARLVVRINAIGTPHFEVDLRAVALPGVALINLPKPESAADVLHAARMLEQAEAENGGRGRHAPIGLLLNIETPTAWFHAAELGAAHPRVAALQLGLGDLFGPLGIERHDSANVHAAMFGLRLAAGQAQLPVCDGAYADIANAAGFRAEAQLARRLGYIGKSCIHPSQVALANEVFAPRATQLAAAQRIVEAARQAAAEGQGAFVVDGRMIDAPYLSAAQALLSAANVAAP